LLFSERWNLTKFIKQPCKENHPDLAETTSLARKNSPMRL
jgi:hypothetical protein